MYDNRQQVLDKVIEMVIEKMKPSEALDEDSTVATAGGDSVDEVEVIMDVEKEFGIDISDEDSSKMKSMGNIADYVCDVCGIKG